MARRGAQGANSGATSARIRSTAVGLPAPLDGPDIECLDRLTLALHHEWLEGGYLDAQACVVQDRSRREDLPRRRLSHDPRGEVHRVALDRVTAPKRRTEVAR